MHISIMPISALRIRATLQMSGFSHDCCIIHMQFHLLCCYQAACVWEIASICAVHYPFQVCAGIIAHRIKQTIRTNTEEEGR